MIFRAREYEYNLERRVLTMGILNVTPDSFSEDGRYEACESAVAHALEMIDAGADIIDIGGESTRPGAQPVDAEEECRRVLPVVEALSASTEAVLSIDTYKSEVAAASLERGAHIINDISGFHRDPAMAGIAADYQAGCILMHMRGTPQTMQAMTDYDDIIGDISAYFGEQIQTLVRKGIAEEYICLDSGIGFSKTCEQNLWLVNQHSAFLRLGRPLLLGPSRKSFIGKTLGIEDPMQRDWGTAAVVACGVLGGARVIRVHDVKQIKQVADMALAVALAEEPGT